MSETLHYIDDYFTGALSPAEKQAFEQRCVTDHAFAQEVAFYVSTRAALKEELQQRKQQLFRERYPQTEIPAIPVRSTRRLLPYMAAAACLLLLLGWYFLFRTATPPQLASQYISRHLQQQSVTMNGSTDSLQSGIAAYNQQDYTRAEHIFQALSRQESTAPEAVKYLGLVYLLTEKYDKAITQFDLLIQYPLYANPGPFYKALALMKRNQAGDLQQAKALLQDVQDRQLPGNKEAAKWLKNI